MGAIQGSINNMLGTAAVAIGGAKKVQADAAAAKSANTEEMIKLTEQIPAEEVNLADMEKEKDTVTGNAMEEIAKQEKIKSDAEKVMKESNVPGREAEFNQADEAYQKADEDIEKQQKAIKQVEGKVAAKKMQINYYKERMNTILGGKK